VRRMTRKAELIVTDLFGVFMDDPRMLPPQYLDKVRATSTAMDGGSAEREAVPTGTNAGAVFPPDDKATCARVVADYIAGMTDRYAIREHKRLHDPSELT